MAVTVNAMERNRYILGDAVNIDEIQHLDGSYWDYDYEGRATAAVCLLNPVPLRTLRSLRYLESGLINRKDRKEHKKGEIGDLAVGGMARWGHRPQRKGDGLMASFSKTFLKNVCWSSAVFGFGAGIVAMSLFLLNGVTFEQDVALVLIVGLGIQVLGQFLVVHFKSKKSSRSTA